MMVFSSASVRCSLCGMSAKACGGGGGHRYTPLGYYAEPKGSGTMADETSGMQIVTRADGARFKVAASELDRYLELNPGATVEGAAQAAPAEADAPAAADGEKALKAAPANKARTAGEDK